MRSTRSFAAPRWLAVLAAATALAVLVPSAGAAPGGPWDCIRANESGGTTDTAGNYADPDGGAYQFLDSTWQSLGRSGSAEDASPGEQDAAAIELQARSGWGQWTTAAECGATGDGGDYGTPSPGEEEPATPRQAHSGVGLTG